MAFKKRKFSSITNLGSWIKSKVPKRSNGDDDEKENVGHFCGYPQQPLTSS